MEEQKSELLASSKFVTTMDELLDRQIGPIGTPERDAFEDDISREIRRFKVEMIKQQIRRNVSEYRYGNRKKKKNPIKYFNEKRN